MEDHADWIYSVEIFPLHGRDLASLRVTVTQRQRLDFSRPTSRGKPKSFTLYRWIPDPAESRAL